MNGAKQTLKGSAMSIRKTSPILLTGCARSGTSLTAGIVEMSGAFGGVTSGPNSNNKKGMFENSDVRNYIVKPYLRLLGVDPMGQNPLPDVTKLLPYKDFRNDIYRVMQRHGYKRGPWYYKGAKMCLFWPVLHEAFPDAKWVIVRRDDEGIINSCLKTGFMRAHKTREGWLWWTAQHKHRFQEMKKAGLNIKQVWPAKFIAGDLSEIKETIAWLGLDFKEKQVKEFISPELWGPKDGR